MPPVEIVEHNLPTVAIVGRPNVGKSTLFNRIVGRRKAVVLDTPGMTRDRNIEKAEWGGREFLVIDTGGYDPDPRDEIYDQMREQSLLAVEQADLAVLLVDGTEEDNPIDREVADVLRRSGKPILLAVNKCDTNRRVQEAVAFYGMGFEDLFAVSAANGTHVAELLDRLIELLPEAPEAEDRERNDIRIAVVGRPNVGKSSLVNAILGGERVIVNAQPGTTRDPIDTTFRHNDRLYTVIDTAGLRRRGKIERGIEKLSAIAGQANLRRCDVALVLIDATDGLTDQDKHIAGYVNDAGRGCILVINKWDAVEKDTDTAGEWARRLRDEMGFLGFAPIVMVSALTGQRVQRLLGMVDKVHEQLTRRIDTSTLNKWLDDAVRRQTPPFYRGKSVRIKYVAQTRIDPPTFTFFANDPDAVHFSYERYLSNQLRKAFGFEGAPLVLRFKRKSRRKGEEEPSASGPPKARPSRSRRS